MIFQKHIFKLALFFSAFFLAGVLFSQNNILELLPGTKKALYDKKNGRHRLIGTVSFIYQGNTMYCDSAHYQEKQKIVYAYGNVQIRKGDINVFCDSAHYYGDQKLAKLWGNVRVRDQEYKITSESMDYDAQKGKALYRNFGIVESIVSDEKVSSKNGYFFPKTGSFCFSNNVYYQKQDLTITSDTLKFSYEKQTVYFYGPTNIINDSVRIKCNKGWYEVNKKRGTIYKNAEVIQEQNIIRGDTIYYDSQREEVQAKGNAFYKDLKENLTFLGNRGYSSNLKHISYISGNAVAIKTNGKDTVYIFADSLILKKDDLNQLKKIVAHNKVRVFENKLQAISDSAEYDQETKILKLRSNPVVWTQNSELKGEKMDISLSDSLIEKIQIIGKTSAIMELDSGKYYNQASGREMIASLKNNEFISAEVIGNAWTIFYPQEDEKSGKQEKKKRTGMNRLYASQLKLDLDSGEVTGITYYDKPDGVFFPIDQIKKEEMYIKNFELKTALRPKRPNFKLD